MPLYEYACNQCGHHFDVLRSMKESDAKIECAECHSMDTKRMPSLCYSHSDGHSVNSSSGSSCSGCSGGSCSTCGH